MELLDSYFELHESLEEVRRIEDNLSENGKQLRLARDRAEEYESELQNVEVLRENIRTLENKGVSEYVEGGEDWEKEGEMLHRITDAVSSVHGDIEELSISSELGITQKMDDSPNDELLADAFEALETSETRLQHHKQEMVEALNEAEQKITELHGRWESRNEQRKDDLQELAAEIEDEIGVDIHEYFNLKAEENALRETERELEEVQSEIEDLQTERETLLDKLSDARAEVTSLRRQGVADQ
ncbi:hypothetical protein [Halococcus salifodinae]|uniref:Uncharacterized protein n=1 Tax=Halococcus salifodinae DSM 8989 TaxID=1227456 RepID=M0NCP4_9EURY|nr:hypothetical protein [Halococcus salifodinae]EMA55606.1 hypothetical protein C450_01077 [Halococcus salifodinae DSM 8989]